MTKKAQQTVLAAELPERGQPLAGGVFVTRYWLNGVERALILLPDELSGAWGEYGVEIKGAGSYSDGESNTRAMAEAGSMIAIKALELDGFIPSCLEGRLLMAAKADGLVELREDRWHWLSSQRSAYDAYTMDFEDGWLNFYGKLTERLARPVRRFKCCSLPVRGSRPRLLRLPSKQAERRKRPAVREGHGDQLRGQGYEVENPADHGIVEGAQWADYMAYDLTRLGLCGQVALLPGCENSKGARLEVHIARELGMTVVNAHDLVSMEIAG